MHLVMFSRGGNAPEAGVVRDGEVIALSELGIPDLLWLTRGGLQALARVRAWIAEPPPDVSAPIESVQLLAPIPCPPKILCVGLNYKDHAEETQMAPSSVPTIFAKFPTAVIGPGASIVLPKSSTQTDYEAEFAFVIGEGGRHIPASEWRQHVFGYTIMNDVSARDYQMASSQWTMGKNFDTFAPMGPWIVTADEIADPHALDISLTLNGVQMQSSNTRNQIFRIPELIAFLSSVFTLEPGDVVSTGTPAGVGYKRKPPVFLQPGDEVVVRVEGLGELRNPVVSESV